jgi:hypothetical protein
MENQTSTDTFPINNFKIALFYETLSRIPQIGTTGTYNTSRVKGDIEYMATTYFGRPNYLKIDGKPVLFVYLTRVLQMKNSTNPSHSNLLSEVIDLMREAASSKDYLLYIAGDQAYGSPPTSTSYTPFTLLNAVFNYDVYGSMGRPLYANSSGVQAYKNKQQGWKTKANNRSCAFFPSVTPGFNKKGGDPTFDQNPMSRRVNSTASEGSLFTALLTNAWQMVDNKNPIAMITSFNEWHEDTQIEPVRPFNASTTLPTNLTSGLTYVAYGTTYLDIVKTITKK